MGKFFGSIWKFLVRHKKKALTVVAAGAAAAADGMTGFQTVQAIIKAVAP